MLIEIKKDDDPNNLLEHLPASSSLLEIKYE